MYSKSPKAKRLEFRCPDPSCNGYLAWSAMLMAMIDGIQNKIDPGKPLDRDIYEMTRDEMQRKGIRTTPGSLEEAVDALDKDHAFLMQGGVFTDDLVQTWIELETREGTRSDPAAAASARVLAVLRQLEQRPTPNGPTPKAIWAWELGRWKLEVDLASHRQVNQIPLAAARC